MNACILVGTFLALPLTDPAAVDELLASAKGLAAARTQAGMESAVALLEKSLEQHSGEARIHARLSELYGELAYWGFKSPQEMSKKCKLAAFKATELHATSPEALTAMGYSGLYVDFDLAGAEASLTKALRKKENYVPALRWLSRCQVCQGKYTDAQVTAIKAATMEPKSAAALLDAGWAFFAAGDWDQAADYFRKSIEADPAAPAGYMYYGMTQLKQTKKPEGFASLEKGFDASGQAVWAAARLGAGRAVAGNPRDGEEALVQVSKLGAGKFVSPYDMALIYASIGEKETAFTWLDRAMTERSPRLMDLCFDPFFYRLHSDPRFKGILKQLNLPELTKP